MSASTKDTPDTKREILANQIYGSEMGCTATQQQATRGAGTLVPNFELPKFLQKE